MPVKTQVPISTSVVLVGGGHTHALVLRRWAMAPLAGVQLTVINPDPVAPYTGMLPGYVAGHYLRDDLDIDLVRLARAAGARFVQGRALGIDRSTKCVLLDDRPPIAYDIASVDVGVSTALSDIEGFDEHAIGAKPLGAFAACWDEFLASTDQSGVAVLGAGLGGVELALAMRHRLHSNRRADKITLIDRETALATVSEAVRSRLLHALAENQVDLIEEAEVAAVSNDGVTLSGGKVVDAELVVGTAGARPYPWVADIGLDVEKGFIKVDQHLRSLTDPSIYACGDCAHLTPSPRPKAGVFAVRQAPVLYHNIRADLTGRQRRNYRPQSRYLKLVSMGRKTAVADGYILPLAGDWVWNWKDRIDRRFMERLGSAKPMQSERPKADMARESRRLLADAPPLCGGCAAKLAPDYLTPGLSPVGGYRRADVLTGPGDDAAILSHGDGFQIFTTDHLRAFTHDPYLLSRIAAHHSLNDVFAMGGDPQAVLASVILPEMSGRLQADMLREIMAGAVEVIAQAGADLVGGQTSIGAELSVGFSVTGLRKERPIEINGARTGDRLILTKALGSGTILAAEMGARAKGVDVRATFAAMDQSQKDASRCFSQANAMTDVTGFGLLGHLRAICIASDCSAVLDLDQLRFLPGALTLAQSGVRSSLFEGNLRSVSDLVHPDLNDPRQVLLLDPQTSGGLLASVPLKDAARCLLNLRVAGYDACDIGEILDGGPAIKLKT